jgi:fibronectin-binding autotransporter adhesin
MSTNPFIRTTLLAAAAIAAINFTAGSATRTWTGTTSVNWSVGTNWGGTAPVGGDLIVFGANSNVSNTNDILAGTSFGSFTISSARTWIFGGNSLTLTAGATAYANNAASRIITINFPIVFSTAAPTMTTVAGGTTTLGTTATINNGGLLLTVSSAGTTTLGGVISGAGGLTKSGAGALTISGANLFSGPVTLSAGTLNINTATAIGSGSFTINGGIIDNTTANPIALSNNNTQFWGTSFTFTGTRALDMGAGAVTLTASPITMTINGASNAVGLLTINGAIGETGGARALTKAGTRVLTLSGNNTFSGGLTLSAGTLNLNNAGALGTGTFTIGGGTIDNTAGASGALITLNSYPRTITASFAFTGTRPLDLGAGAVTLNGTPTITVNGTTPNCTLFVGGAIGETGGARTLTKAGAGALILENSGSYTGLTTVSAGVLQIRNATSLGTTAAGTSVTSGAALELKDATGITVGAEALTLNGTGIATNGALRNIQGKNFWGGTVTLGLATTIKSSADTLILNAANSVTAGNLGLTIRGAGHGKVLGTITIGSGTVTKNDAGTWILGGNSTYTGLTTVSAGRLRLGATGTSPNGPLGTTGAGTSVTSGATLDLGGYSLATAEALTINGTGILSGGALSNSGANATWSGLVTLGSTGASIVGESGTIGLTNTGTITGAGFALTLGGATGGSITSIIGTTTGAITKTGAGTWTLSGNSTYTGLTTISAGTLKLGAAGTTPNSPLGTTGNRTTVNTGGCLDLAGFSLATAEPLTLNGTGVLSSGAFMNSGGNATWSGLVTIGSTGISIEGGSGTIGLTNAGTITGAGFNITLGGAAGGAIASIIGTTTGTLTKEDAGTWILTGANTFSGLTTINTGTLQLGNATATGSLAAGNNITNNSPASPGLKFNRTSGNNYTFSGSISGAGSIEQAGANILILTADNGFSGSTTISTGTLQLGNNTATGTVGGSITNNAALTINHSTAYAYNDVISGTGTVTQSGTGVLTLGGTNSYSGITTISSGTTIIVSSLAGGTANSNLGNPNSTANTYLVINGGTLSYNGSGSNSDRLFTIGTGTTGATIDASGAGALNLTGTGAMGFSGAATRTLVLTGTNTADNTLAAAINNDGGSNATSVTKAGAGTWVLSGTSNYTGVTTISSGILKVSSLTNGNSTACNIGKATNAAANIVLDGGTLQYTGGTATIDRSFTLNTTGGTIDASGSGALTLTGGVGALAYGSTGTRTLTLTGSNANNNTLGHTITDNSGATSVIKDGTGTWTLTATNTHSGTTTVREGTLNLTASLSGPLTVEDGGIYRVGGTGAIAAITTGSLNIQTGGSIAIEINGPRSGVTYDQTVLNGTVTLGGDLILTLGYAPTTGQKDTIIKNTHTTNLVSGTFNGISEGGMVSATYNSISYDYTVSYVGGTNSNDVVLTCQGQATSWKNNAGSTAWNTSGNWTNGVPTSSGLASFAATGYARQPNIDAASVVTGLSMTAGSDAITIGGATYTLTIGTSGIQMGAATNPLTINAPIIMSGAQNWAAATTLTISGSTLDNGGFTITTSGVGTKILSAAISGSGGITKSGAATLTLSGNNSFTGGISQTSGTLNINSSTALGGATSAYTISGGTINNSSAGAKTLSNNNAQTWNGSFIFTGSQDLNMGTGNVTLGISPTITVNGSVFTVGGVISGAYSLTKDGPGTMVIAGANSFTQGLTVNAGTLRLGASGVVPDGSGNGDVTIGASGTFNLYGFSETVNGLTGLGTVDNTVTGGPYTLTIGNNNASSTFLGVIKNTSGALAITKTGSGSLTLSGNNLFTGGVTMNAGTLNINSATALGGSAGTFTIAGGTIDNASAGGFTITNNNPQAWNGSFAFSGTRDLNMGVGAVTLGATPTLTVNNTGIFTEGGVISGSFGLSKAGAGIMVVSGANTFSGDVTVSAGTLRLGAAGVIPDGASKGNVSVTGILDLYAYSETVNGLSGNGTVDVTNGAGAYTLTAGGNNATSAFSGTIQNSSGTLALTKIGSGILTLSNTANSWSGATSINAGTLQLGASNVIPDGADKGDVSVAGIFDLNGFSETVNGLTGNGAIDNVGGGGASALTVGNNDVSSSFTGVIKNTSGTVALTKTGTGALTLTGACLHTGTTTISGGTFNCTGSLAGPLTIQTGALYNVAGSGTTAVINTGNLNIQSGGTFAVEVNGATTGTNYDQNKVTGTVTLGGTLSLTLGYAPTVNTSDTIISNDGADAVTGIFTGIPASGGFIAASFGGITYTFTVSYAGGSSNNDVVLTCLGSESYWTGNGVDVNWSTPGNWSGNVPSGSNQAVHFSSVSQARQTTGKNDISGLSLSMVVANIPAACAIVGSGTSFTLDDGGIDMSAATNNFSIAQNITFSADQAYTIASGKTLTLSGSVTDNNFGLVINGAGNFTLSGVLGSGSCALTMNSSGIMTLSAANTYNGNTTVDAGTLRLGASNVIPDGSGYGNVNVDGTLDLFAFSETVNGLTGVGIIDNTTAGTPTLTVGNNDATATFDGIIKNTLGTLALTKTGSGTFNMTGNNAYSGVTTISGGSIALGSASALGTIAGKTVVNSGYTLDLNGQTYGTAEPVDLAGVGIGANGAIENTSPADASFAGPITLTANSTIGTTNADIILTGNIGGAFKITVKGNNTLTLSGNNNYTGTTTLSGGTLALGSATALGTTAGGTTVSSGYTLDLNGINYTTAEAVSVSGTGVGGNGAIINGAVADATFAGAVTMTGSTTIATTVGNINLTGIFDGGNSDNLTALGSYVLTLSGTNTYRGTTTVSGGTLRLNNTAALGTTNGGTTVNSGYTLDLNGINYATAEALSIAGTGVGSNGALVNTSAAGATFAGAITLAADASIGTTTGNITLSANIGGSYGITALGSNVLILSGTNNYTGITTLSGGTLRLNNTSALGTAAGKTVVGSGFTLDLNGINYATAEPLDLSGAGVGGNGALINGSGTPAVFGGVITLPANGSVGGANNITLSNTITDGANSYSITKAGAGALTLSVAAGNTYDGGTTVSGGTLLATNTSNSATGTGAVVVSGGTLGGTGIIGGAVDASNGTLAPGVAASGKLTITKASGTALTMNGSSVLNVELGTSSDTIACTGTSSNVTIAGTVNVAAVTGFTGITYKIITCTGTITNSGLAVGVIPGGYTASIIVDNAGTPKTVSLAVVENKEWIGANNGTWNTNGNWQQGSPPSTYSTVFYANLSTASPMNQNQNISSLTILGMQVTNNVAGGDPNINAGNAFTIGAGGIDMGGSNKNLSISTGLTIGNNQNWNVNTGKTLTASGAVTLTNNLTINSGGQAGTVLLSGANSGSGIVTVLGGTLRVGNAFALGDVSGKTVINSGYTLDLNGVNYSTAEPLDIFGTGIGAAGAIVNSSGTPAAFNGPITLLANSAIGGANDITLGNAITDGASSFSIAKEGAGTLVFSNAAGNTYDGGTTVNTGALLVTNSSGSGAGTGAVSVTAGTFGGTGIVSGAVTVANGATVQPGNSSAGTLRCNGGLVLNNTTILDYDVGTATDQIAVTGNLTLDGVINITNGAGFGTGTYTILTYTGALTDRTLTIGTTPGGYPTFIYTINTTTTGQIKLMITTGIWSLRALGTINGGAIADNAIYVGSGTPDSLYSFSLVNGSVKWSYPTGHGACKNPTYDYNGSEFKIVAAAADWVIGRQDNGAGSSDLWAPAAINLPGAGTPYISIDGNSFIVPYSGNLTKRNMANPASSPVTVAVTNISTSADMVVNNNHVYVATTDGCINRFDAADLTHLTTYGPIAGSPSITLPLLESRTTLYVLPDNGTVQAINIASMTSKWTHPYSQAGNNTGPAFLTTDRDTLYTAAGNYVYKIADKGTSAAEAWYYNAGATVGSGPIFYNGTVYFGSNGGSYFLINDATGAARPTWPRTSATGNATTGPWIDAANNQVLFGTTGGNLDAFSLEP